MGTKNIRPEHPVLGPTNALTGVSEPLAHSRGRDRLNLMKKAPPVEFKGVKVRCENWYWNRQLQLLLARVIGCSWGAHISVPFNVGRPLLVIQLGLRGWYFSWATESDFEQCPLPEWSAKALFNAYPGAKD